MEPRKKKVKHPWEKAKKAPNQATSYLARLGDGAQSWGSWRNFWGGTRQSNGRVGNPIKEVSGKRPRSARARQKKKIVEKLSWVGKPEKWTCTGGGKKVIVKVAKKEKKGIGNRKQCDVYRTGTADRGRGDTREKVEEKQKTATPRIRPPMPRSPGPVERPGRVRARKGGIPLTGNPGPSSIPIGDQKQKKRSNLQDYLRKGEREKSKLRWKKCISGQLSRD